MTINKDPGLKNNFNVTFSVVNSNYRNIYLVYACLLICHTTSDHNQGPKMTSTDSAHQSYFVVKRCLLISFDALSSKRAVDQKVVCFIKTLRNQLRPVPIRGFPYFIQFSFTQIFLLFG